ncbi:Retrotransposable element [Phytophthora megakarya]|uniref:Retrotransposable element n=1 Tax=Phytophthora megakarya TaxID=4795 RepID=A0A225UXG5_9STRA|nr:Retrotransposable element [Phytophthora megakarya]
MLLMTRPVLLYHNFKLPFRLATDASKVGHGACLQQDHGRGWQPVAYASRVNNRAESNYSITDCLGGKAAPPLSLWTYVYDHHGPFSSSVAYDRPNLAGRIHRWSLTLQEYEFNVEYRSGATNVVADALSRARAAVRAAVRRQRRRLTAPRAPSTLMRTDTEMAATVGPSPSVPAVKIRTAVPVLMEASGVLQPDMIEMQTATMGKMRAADIPIRHLRDAQPGGEAADVALALRPVAVVQNSASEAAVPAVMTETSNSVSSANTNEAPVGDGDAHCKCRW